MKATDDAAVERRLDAGRGTLPLSVPAIVLIALVAAVPWSVEAQVSRIGPPPLPLAASGVAALRPLSSLSVQTEREVERLVSEAAARIAAAVLMDEPEAKRSALVTAEAVADSALAVQPTVEALYWYATARGLRADLAEGRDQVDLAAAVYEEAQAILEVDPDHAGAHHLLGRLHGGVMRLGRVKRFLAVRLLGGGALSNASWAAAERHFRMAVELEPDRIEHKLELASVLLDTGRGEEARPLLQEVIAARACSRVAAHFQDKARALLEELSADL